mgnify:CR=1 FL=1
MPERRHKARLERELLYGRQPVLEALRAGRRAIYRVLLSETARDATEWEELAAAAARRGASVVRVSARRLDEIAGTVHHQGVLAEAAPYPYVAWEEARAALRSGPDPALALLLDHVQDPQNLGALLRAADATGVQAVLLPADRAAGVTPAAVRASSGAAEHLRVAVVTNLARCMEALQEDGLRLLGLDPSPEARRYDTADWREPLGLVVGGEGRGLGRLVREHCDERLRIPMFGRVASLNAAVAGAVALYEARRQRASRGEQGGA